MNTLKRGRTKGGIQRWLSGGRQRVQLASAAASGAGAAVDSTAGALALDHEVKVNCGCWAACVFVF